jgi:DNA-binding NtrC family response regulator
VYEVEEHVGAARRRLLRALIVEDDVTLRAAIARLLHSRGLQTVEASTVREALLLLTPAPDIIIADFRLPDATALKIFEASCALWPAPIKIALSGRATPDEAFRLARYGVRRYLQKPVALATIWDAILQVREEPPDLRPLVQDTVGHVSLRDLQRSVRIVMVRQALALAKGNHTGAARLLRVSRQAVQQLMRRHRTVRFDSARRPQAR